MKYSDILKGESAGHAFRGNQWSNRAGESSDRPRLSTRHTPEAIVRDMERLAKDGVHLSYRGDMIRADSAGAAAAWQNTVGNRVTPSEMVRTLLGHDHSGVGTVRVTIGSNSVEFRATNFNTHGAEVRVMERTFYDHKEVHHDLLSLKEGSQSSGAVKSLFADAIPLYQKMGMREVTVYANLDAGGYAWGKFGFQASSPERFVDQVKYALGGFLQRVGGRTQAVMSEQAKQEFSDVKKLLETARNSPDAPSMLTNAKFPALDKHFEKEIKSTGLPEKVPATLMRGLLRDKSWDGRLDLTDKAQVDRLKAYCAQKKK